MYFVCRSNLFCILKFSNCSLHLQYAFCQVGTSLSLLDNGMAVMGAPGPLAWKGTIFAKQINGDYVKRDKTLYQGPLENGNVTEKYSYLGTLGTRQGSVFGTHQSVRFRYEF